MTRPLRHLRPLVTRLVFVVGIAFGLLALELRRGRSSGPAVCRPEPVVDVVSYDDAGWV